MTLGRSAKWATHEEAARRESADRSRDRSIDERCEDAFALYVLAVLELAERAPDRAALERLLAQREEPAVSPAERWRAMQRAKGR
jgi:hypothetical protein